jgi:cholest-4-en-3-one 26-monooxygenase
MYQPQSPVSTGLRCRCPRCGEGALFTGFLTLKPECSACHLSYAFGDSGDGPAVFVILLAVAGNETTRNSITHGMHAFTEFPEQWELYKKLRPVTAVDEIVRWATPVTSFQRTALCDTELSGVTIKKGQRVMMVYRSANFDEEVFDDPFQFNILRDPNPHVGFGGTGAHYCIGANLARMTIDLMFNAIADAMPDLTPLGKPERLRSGWLNGVKHWNVDYTGTKGG